MDIYSVTPQMERHMGYVESFGSNKPVMHSYEEDEMANKYLEGAVEDIDDSFVYGELEDNDEESKSEGNVDEDLLQMALDDIAKKLSSKPESRKAQREPLKTVARKEAAAVIKKEIKKVEIKHILKEKGYGGVLQGIF
jgi:predicted Ser/Thr protein kinase